MKTIKLLAFLVVCTFCTTNLNAQINFDFKSADDVSKFSGAQCTLSHVNNDFMKMTVTGGFWCVAPYAPEGGLNWNFDTDKVVVVKEQNKHGDLYVKLYNAANNTERKMKDPLPLTVANSTSLIHIIAFENYAQEYPDIQSGTKTFTNIQIAHEYVSIGEEILVDFIKSFPTIDAAYEFVAPLVEGTGVHSQIESPVKVFALGSGVKITGMEDEELVNVFDTKGSLIKSQRMLNGEISDLTKGVYFVRTKGKIAKVVL